MANAQVKIYTVSQVTALIKTTLRNNLPGRLTVRGEISGWTQSFIARGLSSDNNRKIA